MGKILFVNIDPFAMTQATVVVNEEDGIVKPVINASLDTLGEKLANFSSHHNIEEIKICGNTLFSEKVISDFWEVSNQMFANKNIKIGVIDLYG